MAESSLLSVNEEEAKKEKTVENMISSLTKGKGWVTKYLILYQGFWSVHGIVQSTIFAQQHFKAHSTDILLATNLKCGTTWLKSLVFAIKNRVAPVLPQNEEHPTQIPNPLLSCNAHSLIPSLEFGLFRTYSLEEVEILPSPRLFSTHLPYASLPESISKSNCKIVYLSREPKDMFISMWHFYNNMTNTEKTPISLEEAFDLFCQGVSHYGPFWDHVLGYYATSLKWPEKVILFKYEDLHSDTLKQVKRLANFLGYPFSLEEEAKGVIEEIIQLCSFENLSNLEVNKKGTLFDKVNNATFFRKGKVGDSNNYLTTEMVERLNGITKEKFQGLDLGY